MSDNSSPARTNDDPCTNCPRADCTGCPSAPALLTTPFIDGLSIRRKKPKKKKTWIEKQQKRRGW